MVRARGQYNLLASQAMLNLAEARRREVENRLTRIEAPFKAREIHESSRPATRTSRSARVLSGQAKSIVWDYHDRFDEEVVDELGGGKLNRQHGTIHG